MNLDGLMATSGTTPTLAMPQKQLDKDAFMQLLVAQLQNQDPMQPQDNGEQIAQLANFSSLEQMQTLNEGMMSLILLQQGNAQIAQLAQGAALIGHEVTWDGPDGSGQGVVEGVEVSDGLVVARVGGELVPLIDVVGVGGAPANGPQADDTAN